MQQPCRNWLQGYCAFGDGCRYLHNGAPGKGVPGGPGGAGGGSEQICAFFLNGACRFGASCRNRHKRPEELGGAPPAQKGKVPGKKGPRPTFTNLTWHAGKGPTPAPPGQEMSSSQPQGPNNSIKAATGPYLGKGSELLKVWSMPDDVGHSDGIMSAVVMGDRVCTGGADGCLLLWRGAQAASGLTLTQDTEVALPAAVTALLFFAGSRWLFSGLATGQIKAYRQEPLAEATLTGHTGVVSCLLVHESVLLSGASDASVRVWQYDSSTGTFQCAATLSVPVGEVCSLHVHSNGGLWIGAQKGISCVNLQVMQVAGNIETEASVIQLLGHKSADGNAEVVVAVLANGVVKVYDGAGQQQFSHGPLGEHTTNTSAALLQHPYDGKTLLFCGQAIGYVTVYTLPDFQPRGTFNTGYEGEVTCILDMGTGIFATCGMSGDVVLWRWEDRTRPGGMM